MEASWGDCSSGAEVAEVLPLCTGIEAQIRYMCVKNTDLELIHLIFSSKCKKVSVRIPIQTGSFSMCTSSVLIRY